MRAIFLHLLNTPSVFDVLLAKVATASPHDSTIEAPVISSAKARTLPYLQACIREGLRMDPPFIGLLPKQLSPRGDVTDGMFIHP